MGTFVLVHGAMHGGWCWQDVSRLLRAEGHRVYTPTLTGQGDRRHLLTRDVGIATHVEDLTNLMWFENLDAVHLVLHSYSGVLAGPIAEQAGDRLASVIYLAAFITGSGECLLDVQPPETAARYRQLAANTDDGWRVPATSAFLEQWGITDPTTAAWVGPRLTDFPLRCQTDRIVFDPEPLAAIRTYYVRHTNPSLPSLDRSYQRARNAGFDLHDLACGHDTMIAEPVLTTQTLLAIANE